MASQATRNRPLEHNTGSIDYALRLTPLCSTPWRQKCESENFAVRCITL